ncbi:MAG: hypothetical protein KTR33_12145 [Gammaproteobacteria bacterium]|nr:hypothetical protein [Gammaproteobacteria bacterium]
MVSLLLHGFTLLTLISASLPPWLLVPLLLLTLASLVRSKRYRRSGNGGSLHWRQSGTVQWKPRSNPTHVSSHRRITTPLVITGQLSPACYQCAWFVSISFGTSPVRQLLITRDAVSTHEFRALRARIRHAASRVAAGAATSPPAARQ